MLHLTSALNALQAKTNRLEQENARKTAEIEEIFKEKQELETKFESLLKKQRDDLKIAQKQAQDLIQELNLKDNELISFTQKQVFSQKQHEF